MSNTSPPRPNNNHLPTTQDGTKKRLRPLLVTTDGGGSGSAGHTTLPSSRGHHHQQHHAAPGGAFIPKRARVGDSGGSGSAGSAGAVTVVMFESEGGGTLEIPCPYAARPGVLTRIVTDFAGFGVGMMGGGVDGEAGDNFMEEEEGAGGMGVGVGMGQLPRLPVVLDCQVEEGGAPGLGPWPMSRLRASRGGRLLWREMVPGRVTTLCGNATVAAAGCQVRWQGA